jgi:hypothetical protein
MKLLIFLLAINLSASFASELKLIFQVDQMKYKMQESVCLNVKLNMSENSHQLLKKSKANQIIDISFDGLDIKFTNELTTNERNDVIDQLRKLIPVKNVLLERVDSKLDWKIQFGSSYPYISLNYNSANKLSSIQIVLNSMGDVFKFYNYDKCEADLLGELKFKI